jgi:hypothetical protein
LISYDFPFQAQIAAIRQNGGGHPSRGDNELTPFVHIFFYDIFYSLGISPLAVKQCVVKIRHNHFVLHFPL